MVTVERLRRSYRLAVSALVIVFLGTYLTVGFLRGSAYPFSSFLMYSTVQTSPYETSQFELVGLTSDGRRVGHLEAPLGMAIFLRWVDRAEEDPQLLERIGRLALEHNERLDAELDLVSLQIVRHTTVVPEHPDIEPVFLGSETVFEIHPGGRS
jgi:hypothetical protein